MKRSFGFVKNSAGGNKDVLVDMTNTMMFADYNTRVSE